MEPKISEFENFPALAAVNDFTFDSKNSQLIFANGPQVSVLDLTSKSLTTESLSSAATIPEPQRVAGSEEFKSEEERQKVASRKSAHVSALRFTNFGQ